MPPTFKRVVNKVSEMTCENCIYSYGKAIGLCSVIDWQCNNPNALKPIYSTRKSENFCSEGEWLYLGKFYNHSEDELTVMEYRSLYVRFAELELNNAARD